MAERLGRILPIISEKMTFVEEAPRPPSTAPSPQPQFVLSRRKGADAVSLEPWSAGRRTAKTGARL